MVSRSRVLLIGVLFAAGCSDRPAADGADTAISEPGVAEDTGVPGIRASLLVSGDWLRANLDQSNLVVIHVGGDRSGYEDSHIPGANFVATADLNEERDGVPNVLRSRESLEATFSKAGVARGSHVVVYGDPLPAARAFVALEYIGHDRVSMLDGGMVGWDRPGAAGSEVALPAGGGTAPAGTRTAIVVDADWVRDHLDDPLVRLIDARPPDQYSGEVPGDRVPRPGHIPGAANLFWETLLVSTDEPRLRGEVELRSLFEARGVGPGDVVVLYCRTGMQASYAYFVARYLGYDAVIYDGSFVDWSPREGFPVTDGPPIP